MTDYKQLILNEEMYLKEIKDLKSTVKDGIERIKELTQELEDLEDCDECLEKESSIEELEATNTLLREFFDKVSDITHAAGLKSNERELLDEIDKISSIAYQARTI